MAEKSPLVRQWMLLRVLSARRYGATIREMVDEMGVSEKTIRRDLETFQAAGFRLVETVEQFGRKKWRLEVEKNQPGMTFNFDEALALYLGRRFLEPLAGTLFWEAAQRAFKKIRSTLGPDTLKYLDRFSAMFHQTAPGISDYSQQGELIDQLMIGIEDRRAVFITYQSLRATEPITYDVYPYGLTYHRGALYLVGHAVERGALRHWKVDRIEDAEVTEVHFQRPEDFDLRDHFAGSFGVFQTSGDGEVCVNIRFAKTVARYVREGRWHASQKLSQQPDGSLLAEFVLDNTEEIKRWILSFGKHAVVLEPEELRKEIQKAAKSLIAAYEITEISGYDSPRRSR